MSRTSAALATALGYLIAFAHAEPVVIADIALQLVKADSAKFTKDLEQYRARLINVAKQERVRNYLTALRKSAKIVDNRAKVLQQSGSPQAQQAGV